jgi:hypothetical protein
MTKNQFLKDGGWSSWMRLLSEEADTRQARAIPRIGMAV